MGTPEYDVDALARRVTVLERQMLALRRQTQRHDEWIDTVSSSFVKRCLWWLQGYRFRRVGRWYAKTSALR